MQAAQYDVCVIGGGINGAGVARDLAGRDFSVLLVDAGDLAGMTSSASSKMLHGGLRYLEYFEFGLVREALREREIILNIAPHISRPMDFILPVGRGGRQRPLWMIRAGLFLYDHLAGRKKLGASHAVDLGDKRYGAVLQDQFKGAFLYTDGQVDDARLVVLNAVSAAEMGADILTYTKCIHINSETDETGQGRWRLLLEDKFTHETRSAYARHIVNAGGPAVTQVLALDSAERIGAPAPKIRQVKGSHIVVDRLYEGNHGYIFQNDDGRVIFLWPFEGRYTLVGTTEEEYEGNPRAAKASEEELDYLCASVNAVCRTRITRGDIRYQFSGVRPLIDSGRANAGSVSRRHLLHEHAGEGGARMISVYGGKLTTYRAIAQEVADKISGSKRGRWTAQEPLPGGDIEGGDLAAFTDKKLAQYAMFDAVMVRRYACSYGTLIDHILGVAKNIEGLGVHYGDEVYEAELRYLIRREFARTSKDILWRRSKLDLHVSTQTKENIEKALPDLLKSEGVEI